MGKLKVVTRLALGFGLILVFLLGISVLGMVGMARINDALTDITAVNNAETKLVSALRNALSQRAIAIRNIALLDDQEGMRVESQTLARQEKIYADALVTLDKMFNTEAATTEREKQLLAQIKADEAATVPLMAKALQLGLDNKPADAVKVLITEVRPRQQAWIKSLTELADFEDQLNEEAAPSARAPMNGCAPSCSVPWPGVAGRRGRLGHDRAQHPAPAWRRAVRSASHRPRHRQPATSPPRCDCAMAMVPA
jgi:methyl-accepting chemotaxis protein